MLDLKKLLLLTATLLAFPLHAGASLLEPVRGDLGAVATRRTVLILAGAAALGAASLAIEDPGAQERALGGGVIDPPADFGNIYGDAGTLTAAAGGLAVAGLLRHNQDWTRAGSELLRSMAYTGAVVTALKLGVRRTRPNGGRYSFPSGHTAVAFAVMPILAHRFGLTFGVPAAALAVSTGLGRLEDRKHFLSDVIFGAGIGTAIGMAIASERGTCDPDEVSAPESPKRTLGLGVTESGLALTARF